MRARQLEVFTAVMRAGTVTGAARLLNISQPALSQILIHTEDELGFALFDRNKGRLHPTPEALEIYPEAERIFGEIEGLRRKTSDLRLGRAGLVRIAAAPPPAMSLLPRALAAFRARHPEVRIRSYVAPLQALIGMLQAGDASLALALNDKVPADLEVEVVGRVGFCCLLPAGHPLAAHETIGFADLAGEMVISYRGMTRQQDDLDKAARRAGIAFEPQIEIDSSITAVGFVQAGLGIAVVDALLPWDQFAGLVQRPMREAPDMPLTILSLRGRTLSRAEEEMRQQIRKLCAEAL